MFVAVVLSILCFSIFLFLGPFGIVLTGIILFFSKGKYHVSKTTVRLNDFLKYFLIVSICTYFVLIPFDGVIKNSPLITKIAEFQFFKTPYAKFYLSQIYQGQVYDEFYIWSKRVSNLSLIFFSYYGAVFVCVNLVVFYAMLFSFFVIGMDIHRIGSEKEMRLWGGVIVFSVALLLFSIDAFYLSSQRVDFHAHLIIPISVAGIGVVCSWLFASVKK